MNTTDAKSSPLNEGEPKKYRFEVTFLTLMAVRVSNLMNEFDLPGRYGVQTEVVKFSSTSGKDPKDYKKVLIEAYSSGGGEVLEVTGGEIV